MVSFCRPCGFGGTMVDLPPFFRRCNAEAWWRRRQQRARHWQRYIQAKRLQALYRQRLATGWHPDAGEQPGEVE